MSWFVESCESPGRLRVGDEVRIALSEYCTLALSLIHLAVDSSGRGTVLMPCLTRRLL